MWNMFHWNKECEKKQKVYDVDLIENRGLYIKADAISNHRPRRVGVRRGVLHWWIKFNWTEPLGIFGEMVQCKNVQWPAQIQLKVESGNGCNWADVHVLSLRRGIDVFGLGNAAQLILITWEAAEEDAAADAEDGGAPAKAIGPGVVIVALEDQLVELDRVDNQSDDLDNHCRET